VLTMDPTRKWRSDFGKIDFAGSSAGKVYLPG
jgi:hypothetical protein